MTSVAKNCKSTVIPGLRYRNAPAAIEWLCKAFGFEKQAAYSNADGTIAHAQLTFGNGMVMVSTAINRTPYSKFPRQPDEIGKVETQTPCVNVSDCDALDKPAKDAEAESDKD